jgi:hypothetical protein
MSEETVVLRDGEGKPLISDADHLALEPLITESAWRVDQGKSDLLSELFIDDGELAIGDEVLKGREAIRAWGRQLEDAVDSSRPCLARVFGPIGMEQLWNRGGATDGKRSGPQGAKMDGKEGVDGSSPSEGFEFSPA